MKKIEMMMDEFMVYCDSKNLSKKTMSSYEQTLRLFIKYLEETYKLSDVTKVTEIMIRQYMNETKNRGIYTVTVDEKTLKTNTPEARRDYGQKVSLITINNYIRNIKVFFNFMLEQGYIKKDIVKNIKQLKTDRTLKEYIADEQFTNLLRYMDSSKYHEYRDSVIIQLLLDSGMRIGECLSINIENLDMNERAIFLPAENTKANKGRYVYFSQIMHKELKRWLQYKDRQTESELLFCTTKGNQLMISTFEKKIHEYGLRVGISICPHQLRNNFARRFLVSGGSIYVLSQILGHKLAYLDLDDDDIKKSYQAFSPLFNLKIKK